MKSKNIKFKLISLIIILIYVIVTMATIINLNKINQIYYCRIQNYANQEKKYVHFSIDDTIEIFDDLTKNKDRYKTIFENKTLKFLKECHDIYGSKFSLYCFYEFGDKSLNNCTDKFSEEFEQNSEWLKFGFHALDNKRDYSILSSEDIKNDYKIVINELKRIVGEKSITTVIRMEKFICSKQNIETLTDIEFGITGLLGADTIDRQDYYLDSTLNNQLFEEDYYYDNSVGIFIYNTDLRIENIDNIYQEMNELKDDKNIIIFTHEWILNSANKNKIKKICEYTTKNGYIYEFPNKY